MNCKECGHLFMKHDDYGCKQSACECMKNQPELTGEYSLPQLPDGLKFLKSGYTKEYQIDADTLYDVILKLINEIGTFKVRKEDRSQRELRTNTKPFGRLLSSSKIDSSAISHLDERFDMDISIHSQGANRSVLSFQLPIVRYKQREAPPEYRRTFFHLHAIEFIRRVDSFVELQSK